MRRSQPRDQIAFGIRDARSETEGLNMHGSRKFSKLLTAAAVTAVLGWYFVQPLHAQQSEPQITDLSGFSYEAPSIKSMVGQGVLNLTGPGKFDPATTLKRGDFANAIQRLFNLPQPAEPIKFSDVHPGDAIYAAVEAVAPYMDNQVPCPEGNVGSDFSPNHTVNRAQWAITVVRILVAQNKLQLLSEDKTDRVLATVPDAKDIPKRARPYVATAIDSGVIECCAGNAIDVEQILSRADAAFVLAKVQTSFSLAPVKAGA